MKIKEREAIIVVAIQKAYDPSLWSVTSRAPIGT